MNPNGTLSLAAQLKHQVRERSLLVDPQIIVMHPDTWDELVQEVVGMVSGLKTVTPSTFMGIAVMRSDDIPRGTFKVG